MLDSFNKSIKVQEANQTNQLRLRFRLAHHRPALRDFLQRLLNVILGIKISAPPLTLALPKIKTQDTNILIKYFW